MEVLPRVEVQISGMDTLNMVPLLTSCSQRADIEIIINNIWLGLGAVLETGLGLGPF